MSSIKIKHKDNPSSIWYRSYEYIIYDGSAQIGFISMKIKRKILIIGYLHINKYYRNSHYGYEVVSYLLSHYKINCIIGQTLEESRTFWHKCIKRYNGQRRNIYTLSNCTSSFIIPRYKISNYELEELLDIGHEIEM